MNLRDELERLVERMRSYATECENQDRGGIVAEYGRADASRKWADELAALLAQHEPDPLVVDDHCPDCGESEPECLCTNAEPTADALPLMARRPGWAAKFVGAKRRSDCVGLWLLEGLDDAEYRIADIDEHGLPVVPRTADMPKWAKYRRETPILLEYQGGGFAIQLLLPEPGWQRIEDFTEHGAANG